MASDLSQTDLSLLVVVVVVVAVVVMGNLPNERDLIDCGVGGEAVEMLVLPAVVCCCCAVPTCSLGVGVVVVVVVITLTGSCVVLVVVVDRLLCCADAGTSSNLSCEI